MVCPKIETKFLGKLGISNVFSAQKQVVSKKKKKGLHRNLVCFFGQNPKFKRLFTPHHNMHFTTSASNFLWGVVFNFSPKIGLKSYKNVRFCILHKPMGGLEPPRPPLATLLTARILVNYDLYRSILRVTICNFAMVWSSTKAWDGGQNFF